MFDYEKSVEYYPFFIRCISSFAAGFFFIILSKQYAPEWLTKVNCRILQYLLNIILHFTSWNSYLKSKIDENDANRDLLEKEIDSIVDKVLLHYVESWYGDISKDEEFLLSVRSYFNIIKEQALINIQKLNKEKLVVDCITIFRSHLKDIQELDYDYQRSGLLAIGNLLTMSNLAPPAIPSCLPAKWLLIHMFERNILEMLLEKLSSPDFIYESIIQILSDRIVKSSESKAQKARSIKTSRRVSFYAGNEIDDNEDDIEHIEMRMNEGDDFSLPSSMNSTATINSGEDYDNDQRDVECSIESAQEALDALPDAPKVAFEDVLIEGTEFVQDQNHRLYVSYNLSYKMWEHEPESRSWKLKSGFVKRRYAQFVELQECLERKKAYRKVLKGLRTPRRWPHFASDLKSSKRLQNRIKYLGHYLKEVSENELIGNSEELTWFLSPSSSPSVAYLRKLNESRKLDTFVNTVSGVIAKFMPSSDLNTAISGLPLDGSTSSIKLDDRHAEFSYDVAIVWKERSNNSRLCDLNDILCSYICHVDETLDGTNIEDINKNTSTDHSNEKDSNGNCKLSEAVLDLAIDLTKDSKHWFTQYEFMTYFRNIFGSILNQLSLLHINRQIPMNNNIVYLSI
ncbi:DgyrCDS3639 [Dimorphilus gyrociliatus]|uniref:DgyrCDS3639 n=1 Tax=Dimorphilus gyrociliatus TaxID=2664684 RepID=A0A7I8VEE0_9ANNE|nr:DgyrCDS3639 [Dimorphilus gyrociliatus]